MNKNKLSVYFIFIALFTVITIFVSIVQKSYSNLIGPSQKIETDNVLKPITPVLDSSIIQEIQNRSDFADNQELNIIDDTDLTPTPTPTTPINNEENEISAPPENEPDDEE